MDGQIEFFSWIAGIMGTALAIVSIILIWRKGLLESGFKSFQTTYRIEMDVFKDSINSGILDFKKDVRGYISSHHEENNKKFDRIIELYEQTHKEVSSQTNICRVIQGKKEGVSFYEQEWKRQIEQELNEVKEDVKHIRSVINHDN